MRTHADCIVIGGGIAGASVAWWLAPHVRVVLLERESQPGYHATGRSAALFMESYGSPQVRALTRASRSFLWNPPEGFAPHALVSPRGALMVAAPGELQALDEHWEMLRGLSPAASRLGADETRALVPVLRPELVLGGAHEPDAADMDVHALHQGYLRGLRRHGGELVCSAEVSGLTRQRGDWLVEAGARSYAAPVVLNAAGAWVDAIAQMAGVRPSSSPRPRACGLRTGRWSSAPAKAGTSSPTPACCWAHRPMPTWWRHTTCSRKSWTSPPRSTASRKPPR